MVCSGPVRFHPCARKRKESLKVTPQTGHPARLNRKTMAERQDRREALYLSFDD
jgi:hypothetical protein